MWHVRQLVPYPRAKAGIAVAGFLSERVTIAVAASEMSKRIFHIAPLCIAISDFPSPSEVNMDQPLLEWNQVCFFL